MKQLLQLDARLFWMCIALLFVLVHLSLRWLGTRWSKWRGHRKAVKRSKRSMRGEAKAEKLLKKNGYEIISSQHRQAWAVEHGEEIYEFELRADFLVRRKGRTYVAEVKTGDRAPDIRNSATRRQLLEYSIAYECDTVLLVQVEKGLISPVRFFIPEED